MNSTSKAVLMLLIGAIGSIGCSQERSTPGSMPGGTRMVIQTARKTYTSAMPAELKATFGSPAMTTLSIVGSDGAEVWSIHARPQLEPANKTITATITAGALVDSLANLDTQTHQGMPQLVGNSGTLHASVQNGKITGTVQAQPPDLSATLSGDLIVSCWVPRTASPSTGGTTDPNGSVALVQDADFNSPQCQSLRTWLSK